MSEISFCCPGCQQPYSLAPEYAGAVANCEACGSEFTVPEPVAAPVPAAPAGPVAPSGVRHVRRPAAPAGSRRVVQAPASRRLPGPVRFLGWYYVIGSLFFILFSAALFFMDMKPNSQSGRGGEAFMFGIKCLMGGGLLIYSLAHFIAGIGLLRRKPAAFKAAGILSLLGAVHLNPLVIPAFLILDRPAVRACFGLSPVRKGK